MSRLLTFLAKLTGRVWFWYRDDTGKSKLYFDHLDHADARTHRFVLHRLGLSPHVYKWAAIKRKKSGGPEPHCWVCGA